LKVLKMTKKVETCRPSIVFYVIKYYTRATRATLGISNAYLSVWDLRMHHKHL